MATAVHCHMFRQVGLNQQHSILQGKHQIFVITYKLILTYQSVTHITLTQHVHMSGKIIQSMHILISMMTATQNSKDFYNWVLALPKGNESVCE